MEDCLKVRLSDGSEAVISACDAEVVFAHKWRPSRSSATTYAMTQIDGKTIYMHRLILGAASGEYVDHKDHDGLNNTRENIAICSQSQNAAASKQARVSSTTGIRGIHKHGRKWRVTCGRDARGRTQYAGTFVTLEEAVEARKRAATDRWGEFARYG